MHLFLQIESADSKYFSILFDLFVQSSLLITGMNVDLDVPILLSLIINLSDRNLDLKVPFKLFQLNSSNLENIDNTFFIFICFLEAWIGPPYTSMCSLHLF